MTPRGPQSSDQHQSEYDVSLIWCNQQARLHRFDSSAVGLASCDRERPNLGMTLSSHAQPNT